MSGNVYDWCWDWFGSYSADPRTDPKGPDTGPNRVLRGGAWLNNPVYVRCAYRVNATPDNRSLNIGFRLARTLTF